MERKYDKASVRIKELEAQAAVPATSSGGDVSATSAEAVAGANLISYAKYSRKIMISSYICSSGFFC